MKRIETICIDCGAKRNYYPSSNELRKRCRRCAGIELGRRSQLATDPSNMIELICAVCRKLIVRKRCLVVKLKTVPTCSNTCRKTAMRSKLIQKTSRPRQPRKSTNYGPGWKTQSQLARDRDRDCCQECGISRQDYGRTLDVHHIVRFQDFTTPDAANVLSNLQTLCVPCHRRADAALYRARKLAGHTARRMQRRPSGVRQFVSLSELVCLCARNWRLTTYSGRVEGECVGGIAKAIAAAWTHPTCSRGLAKAVDLCQVRTLAQCNAEIETNCWRFTLAGGDNSMSWCELLQTNAYRNIVSAERVAYLDWMIVSDETEVVLASYPGPRIRPAIRRKWDLRKEQT